MISNIVIRRALIEDCPSIMKLIHELAQYEKAPQEVTVSLEHFTQSGFGQNPVWWVFVAVHNQDIVAVALYYIRYST